MKEKASDLRAQLLVSMLSLSAIVAATYLVLEPFVQAMAWATILVLASWPIYRRLSSLLPGKPRASAFVMTLWLALLLAAAVAPILVALVTELDSATVAVKAELQRDELRVPKLVSDLPLVGKMIEDRLLSLWHNKRQALSMLSDYQEPLVDFFTTLAKGVLSSVFTLLMCLFIAFFLFLNGPELAHQFQVIGRKLGGDRFDRLVAASRETVKGAVYGVLLTALVQGVLAGIGYAVAGAPVPVLLGFFTMVMSLIPFGTPIVYLPVAVIVGANGAPLLHGILLAAWGICVVSAMDNILRPLFISQSTNMPIVLSFFGVIGGIIAFGLLGIILGPVVLAIALMLWREWAHEV